MITEQICFDVSTLIPNYLLVINKLATFSATSWRNRFFCDVITTYKLPVSRILVLWQLYRSTHSYLTIQLGGISPKLSPLIGVTTSAFVWKLGMLTPPTLLSIVTMAVYFLTPISTSSEKRQLISDRIKASFVAAFRSPLMKALDRSVETLSLNCNFFGYIH